LKEKKRRGGAPGEPVPSFQREKRSLLPLEKLAHMGQPEKKGGGACRNDNKEKMCLSETSEGKKGPPHASFPGRKGDPFPLRLGGGREGGASIREKKKMVPPYPMGEKGTHISRKEEGSNFHRIVPSLKGEKGNTS